MEVTFKVNGKLCRITTQDLPPDTSLNTYLRTHLNLTGTKFMCQEGGCDCCVVTLQGVQPVTKEKFTLAVNSCLFFVFSCHGLNVTTIEGIGSKKTGYHAIQERLAHFNGTQCGFCSPGFVMSMYSLYKGNYGNVTAEEVEDSFGGNICRCTGYRPILDAFKSFATNASQDLKSLCGDIEDLSLKKCPKSGQECVGNCHREVHITAAENAEWHKVYNLSEVLQILNGIGNRSYRLVAGNTARGIYPMPNDIEIFIDVSSVFELRGYTIGDNIVLGGNVPITEWMTILQEAADRMAGFNYCHLVRDHLNRVATIPVRNVGTIAGNLMIKHDHREFASDIFVLLETVAATITIVDTSGALEILTPQDFLAKDMNKKVIKEITMRQLSPDQYRIRFYKMTDRAQNATIYLNAGFLFKMNQGSNIVKSARIVFGKVNSSFVHATSVEKCIKGRNLFDNDTIQAIVNAVNSDFIFDDSLPNSSAEFRRRLAIGLLYKAILNLAPGSLVRPSYKSGSSLIYRPLSSGQQKYDTFPPKYPLSKPIEMVSALLQCSGEAEYINDISIPNSLWATFVLSKEPLKTIVDIDATEALKVRGVKAFYSAKDIPGENSFTSQKFPGIPSYPVAEEVFCSKKVLYHGQPVGIIVAKEMSQAVYAANLVKIQYESRVEEGGSLASFYRYLRGDTSNNEEKILPTLEDVLKEDPKLTEHRFQMPVVVKVATQQGISQADGNIKGSLMCGGQYHYSMETQQSIAIPTEDGIDLYPSTQWMDFTNAGVAQVLGLNNSAIRIFVRRIGGAFGAKISRATQISAAAAVACYHLQRPVRMILPLTTNMRAIGKRTPAYAEYNVDFTTLGAITRLHCEVTHDQGCSLNETLDIYASFFEANAYMTQTWTIIYHYVITDAASNTSMRAPASLEVIANAETTMDHIAWTLKMDPVQVRLANIDVGNPIRKMYTDFLTSCDYYKRLQEVDQFNKDNRWRKRGIATSLMQFAQVFGSNATTLVSIYHSDGSVAIILGGIEMGQGLNTKCLQIASSILGIPMELIKIHPSNNSANANNVYTSGNIGTDVFGNNVKICCETLNTRLAPIREQNPGASWQDIVHKAFEANIELIATHQFDPTQIPPYFIYGVACAEIEIDVLTGDFQMRRVDIVEDIGQSISPKIDVGQIEGGFIMGLGYWLHEKLIYNRSTGELLTDRAWNYKPPGAKDIPVDFRVTLLQTTASPTGVLGSKGASEPAITMAVCVPAALRKALESARKDAGEKDIFITINSGTTKEDILVLAGTKDNQFVI